VHKTMSMQVTCIRKLILMHILDRSYLFKVGAILLVRNLWEMGVKTVFVSPNGAQKWDLVNR
jgi:hypothetical protein